MSKAHLYIVTAHDWSFLHHPRARRFDSLRDAVVALLARQDGERLRQGNGHMLPAHESVSIAAS
jgi:hypothetical protein